MSTITAQVSLYPLRQTVIGSVIRKTVRCLREQGPKVRMGEMSTLVWGAEPAVFAALQRAFHQAAEQGKVVMVVVTFSNVCPEPGPSAGPSPEMM